MLQEYHSHYILGKISTIFHYLIFTIICELGCNISSHRKKKKKSLQRENVISSKLHSKLSWVKFQTLTDCIPFLGLFPLCNIFLNSVRIPFSSNPWSLVCDILPWYNVLKTFFQQDIYMCSSKISILLIGLFVGNTSKCQLDNFQTCPCSNPTEPTFRSFRAAAAAGHSYHGHKIWSRLKQVKDLCWGSKMVAYFQREKWVKKWTVISRRQEKKTTRNQEIHPQHEMNIQR